MSRVFILLSVCFFFLENLLGQEQQQSQPSVEQISSKRTNYNLEEIKVRWKKAALENCVGVPCIYFTCGTSTVSDIEGNSYNTVSIGSQCWLKENLKVTQYNDGTLIPLDNSGGISGNNTSGGPLTWTRTTGARTVNEQNNANIAIYGYLYNWYAAKGIVTTGSTVYKNICPIGWHVPTDSEWKSLVIYIDPASAGVTTDDQSTTAGGKMKVTGFSYWQSPNTGATNESGFSAMPGGFRSDTFFSGINQEADFWSATENVNNVNNSWHWTIVDYDSILYRYNSNKTWGLSVRCLKD